MAGVVEALVVVDARIVENLGLRRSFDPLGNHHGAQLIAHPCNGTDDGLPALMRIDVTDELNIDLDGISV